MPALPKQNSKPLPGQKALKLDMPKPTEVQELNKLRNDFESLRNEFSRLLFRLESLVHRYEMLTPKGLPEDDQIPF